MKHTISEKIMMKYSGRSELKPGGIVTIEPDMVMSHDNSAFIIKKFYEIGIKKVWDKEKIAIIFDHCVPAETPEQEMNHMEAGLFAKEQNLRYFFGLDAGVSHQVMMEKGLVLPGEIILGADSHSTIYGSLGALGIPINRTEMAGIWATGKIWLKVPETIKISLEGVLPTGVYSKDILLKILSILKSDGATYRSIEFTGSCVEGLSISSRMTLANMAVELGAKAGIINFDAKTEEFLKKRAIKKYEPVFSDEDARYEKILDIEVSKMEPQIALPHNVDNVRPVTEVTDVKVNQAYLGSCTNGRIEDLKIAADILRGRKVSRGVKLVVYPASREVHKTAESLGIFKDLRDAGGIVMSASCGPCFGAVGATLKDEEVCISSSNRNFCGRMGSKRSYVYLASPAAVAASCIEGKITDPRKYL